MGEWGGVWTFLLIVFILIIHLIAANFMQVAAEEKGYEDSHAMAICFWLGLPGYLYIIALPDKRVQEQNQEIINILMNRQEEKNYTEISCEELPTL